MRLRKEPASGGPGAGRSGRPARKVGAEAGQEGDEEDEEHGESPYAKGAVGTGTVSGMATGESENRLNTEVGRRMGHHRVAHGARRKPQQFEAVAGMPGMPAAAMLDSTVWPPPLMRRIHALTRIGVHRGCLWRARWIYPNVNSHRRLPLLWHLARPATAHTSLTDVDEVAALSA